MISRDFIMMMIGIIGFILTLAVSMLSCKIEELQKELSFIHADITKLKKDKENLIISAYEKGYNDASEYMRSVTKRITEVAYDTK